MQERPNEAERLAGLLFSAYEVNLLSDLEPGSAFEQAMLRGWLREEAWLAAGISSLGPVPPRPGSWPVQASR